LKPKAPAIVYLLSFLLLGILPAGAAGFTRVVIDAGHGGYDTGTSKGLVYEKHLALDVARRVDYILKKQGIRTTMTRSRDVFIPLSKRSQVSNSYRGSIFVSIHFNSASTNAKGVETFYHSSNRDSYVLARLVQSAVVYKSSTTDRGVKFRALHVLRYNERPAILVECGFITNSSEMRQCLSPSYRQRVAEGIAMGILRYQQGGSRR
jgi:N-acetylmuramoyl-L-alanine amidase